MRKWYGNVLYADCLYFAVWGSSRDGISALGENMEEDGLRIVFHQMEETVRETGSLYQALKTAGIFPAYMVNMVHIGENLGKLEEVMEALADYYEREDNLRETVRSAVMYPLVLTALMVVVIGFLVAKVFPVFTQVVQGLDDTAAASSGVILDLGITVGEIALAVLGILFLVVLALFLYSKTKWNGKKLHVFFNHFFLTKRLAVKIASGRFASVTAMMLSFGCDMDQALEWIPDVITNKTVTKKAAECRERMARGEPFASAVLETGMFSGVHAKMVSIGAAIGCEDTVMKKLADIYEEEIDRSVNTAVSMIEPVMTVVLAVIMGAVLLSVMLPLMSILSSIGC